MDHSSSWRHRFWRAFYDGVAFAYDAVLFAGERLHIGSEEHIRREVIGKLALHDGVRVVEIGCGTASNRACLGRNTRYVGLDISLGMLTRAKRKCSTFGLEADFVLADAEALPFGTDVAELVLAMGILQHVTNLETAITEMQRMLDADGELLIIDERRSFKRILKYVGTETDARVIGEYFLLHFSNNLNS